MFLNCFPHLLIPVQFQLSYCIVFAFTFPCPISVILLFCFHIYFSMSHYNGIVLYPYLVFTLSHLPLLFFSCFVFETFVIENYFRQMKIIVIITMLLFASILFTFLVVCVCVYFGKEKKLRQMK
jgi:hypothetical protein